MTKVSVIMGVYNGANYLEESINSIINQTFKNFEFVICDDGSEDNSLSIIENKAQLDSRIKVLKNTSNKGLGYSLNECIKVSQGKYLVRMDSDDISVENRIEKLVQSLEERPEYAVLGSGMILFDNYEEWGVTTPIEFPNREQIFKGPAVAHATTIMNRKVIEEIGLYNTLADKYRVEDYDLWCRLAEAGYKIMNTNDCLYKCRWDREEYYKRRKLKHLMGYARYKFYWNKRLGFGFKGYLHSTFVVLKAIAPSFIKKKYHRLKLKEKKQVL